MAGLGSIGVVRGEKPANPSFTLMEAEKNGMRLVFMSRADYRLKKLPDLENMDDIYLIPEGGYGLLGAKGAATILDHIR